MSRAGMTFIFGLVVLAIAAMVGLTGCDSQKDSCRHQLSKEYAYRGTFSETHNGKCKNLTAVEIKQIKKAVVAEFNRSNS